MEEFGVIVIILMVCFGAILALAILIYGLGGAALQFSWALEFGFVGVVVFFAAWIFMFPVMAIWAVLWGWLVAREAKNDVKID